MRVLILGAGLVGTFSARALTEAGVSVVAADLEPAPAYFERFGPRRGAELVRTDIEDDLALRALLARTAPDVVVACTGTGQRRSRNDWPEQNVPDIGTSVLCCAVQQQRVKRLVFISSLAVYGQPNVNSVSETEPLRPRTEYGWMKMAAENTLGSLRRDGVDLRVLRPCGLYGPVPARSGSRSTRLINLLLQYGLDGRPLRIDVEGEGQDQYLYVKDLARAVALAALRDNESPHCVFNVGPGENTTILQLCKALTKVVPTSKFTVNCTRAQCGPVAPLDVARVRAAFGFQPQYSLLEGLVDYVLHESVVH